MERLTKLALALWILAAMALQVWILQFSWPALPVMTTAAIAGFALCSWLDRRSVALVLFVSYLFPAIAFFLRGVHSYYYDVVWIAALVGAMLPDLVRSPWHLPRTWRAALVYSALAVAVGTIVVVLREVDWQPLLLLDPDALYWKGGLPPTFTIRWVLHVAVAAVAGILWFDWLYPIERRELERFIVPPLALGACVVALVSAYQLFVDDGFLNDTVFRNLGRTTGTFYDGNVAGMITALWVAGISLWCWGHPRRRYLAPLLASLLVIGSWGSGSRTALMVMAGGGAGAGIAMLFRGGVFRPRRLLWVGLSAAVLASAVAVYGASSARQTNPVGRLMVMFSAHSSPSALLSELWNRNGYGTAAGVMIRESPIAGVGVGSFHGRVGYVAATQGLPLTPDNAQNWLRHQIAELGVIGAAGWIAWTALFAWVLCVPRRGEPSSIWIVRAALLSFAAASMLGMPGQDPAVALTFWLFAAWYLKLRGQPAADSRPLGRWAWAAVAAVLVLFAGTSGVVARGLYRLPERARAEQQPFAYGFGPIFGAGPETDFRNVRQEAVALVEVRGPWLTVDTHLREGGMPAEVRVLVNGDVMMKGRLADRTSFKSALPVHGMKSPLLLELTAVPDRTTRGAPAVHETDVMITWYFSDDVPTLLKAGRARTEKD